MLGAAREVLPIHLVERWDIGEVSEVDRELHGIVQPAPRGLGDCSQILQGEVCLMLEAADVRLVALGVERTRTGDEQQITEADCLRERSTALGALEVCTCPR